MGIVLYRQFPFSFDRLTILVLLIGAISFTGLLLYLSLKDYKTYTLPATIVTLLFFVVFGFFRSTTYNALSLSSHYSYIDQPTSFIGTIADLPTLGKSVKCKIEISACGPERDSLRHASGMILTYLELDSLSSSLKPGDLIAFDVKIRTIKENANPRVFDYRQYLINRNIHYQGFVKKGEWEQIGIDGLAWYWQMASKLRANSMSVINRHITSLDNKAVLSAMLLGIRSLISDELYDAYTDTGAVHVLAVSGLHVGIFSLILHWLFGFIPSDRKWISVAKLIVTLLVIWLFVLVTGAAPAVTRAALMCSFLIVGHAIDKQASTYNILCLTAFVMLLWNPYMLFQASFQFSFLALLSILFFMPILVGYISSGVWIVQKVLSLLFVSAAAQVLVMPLTIFFFHKLATYFWLSGLFVVFAAFLILVFGLALLFVDFLSHYIPLIDTLNTNVIAPILEGIIGTNNTLVSMVQSLPYSAIEGLWLSKLEVAILYAGIVTCMVALSRRSSWLFLIGMLWFVGFTVNRIGVNKERSKTQMLYLYDVYGRSKVDIIDGYQVYSYPETTAIEAKDAFITGNNRAYHAATLTSGLPDEVDVKGAFLSLGDQLLLFAGHDSIYQYRSTVPVDYVVIQDNYIGDLYKMREYFDIRQVIVDGSNRYDTKRAIRKQCYKLRLQYHDTQYGAIEIAY